MIAVSKDGVVIEGRAHGRPVKLSLPAMHTTFTLAVHKENEPVVMRLSLEELEAIARCCASLNYALTPECRQKLRD